MANMFEPFVQVSKTEEPYIFDLRGIRVQHNEERVLLRMGGCSVNLFTEEVDEIINTLTLAKRLAQNTIDRNKKEADLAKAYEDQKKERQRPLTPEENEKLRNLLDTLNLK